MKYRVIREIFIPASSAEPTNGTQPTWMVITSKSGKVQALCFNKRRAKRVCKALNRSQ